MVAKTVPVIVHVSKSENNFIANHKFMRRNWYKRQELLTSQEHPGSSPFFGGVCVAHPF